MGLMDHYNNEIKPLADQLELFMAEDFHESLDTTRYDLATCACGCGEVELADEMYWDDDLPFASLAHKAEWEQNR